MKAFLPNETKHVGCRVSEELHFLYFYTINLCELQLSGIVDACLCVFGKKGGENTANKEMN